MVDETKQPLFIWIQALLPAAALMAGGAIAYGGMVARIDAMVESLRFLRPVPVQIEQLRGNMSQQISAIAADQAARLAELSERVGRVEGNVENIRERIEARPPP